MNTTTERNVSLLFAINAVINWVISLPGIVDPTATAEAFGGFPPNYPSVVRLWQGFVFMFGCLFWEASRDVRSKVALLKYNDRKNDHCHGDHGRLFCGRYSSSTHVPDHSDKLALDSIHLVG